MWFKIYGVPQIFLLHLLGTQQKSSLLLGVAKKKKKTVLQEKHTKEGNDTSFQKWGPKSTNLNIHLHIL